MSSTKKSQQAHKARIFQYFRDNCQGINLYAAKRRIQRRFDVSSAEWRQIKPELEKLVPGAGQSLSDPPTTEATCSPQGFEPQVSIPDNTTPEAKAAISQLVAVNCQQECRIQTLQVENSALRDGVGRSESRVRVLKALLKVVLAAM